MLKAVSSIGSRGWPGGGQISAEPRMIVKADTKPEKSITSVATKISIPSTAFGTTGGRGRGGRRRTRGGEGAVTEPIS